MDTQLFKRFSTTIRALTLTELEGGGSLDARMLLAQDDGLQVCYAPFEYINAKAKLVIVGITPGRTQMVNAIKEARRLLDTGADDTTALVAAKKVGAFSGTMRPNLIALLDVIGVNHWLGLDTCESLFGEAADLVQTTSVLRNPVFVEGKNYNGNKPSMSRHPLLREQLLRYFGEDVRTLKEAVFLPLGDKVAEALQFFASQGLLDRARVLEGLPHPSPLNGERIAYFLKRKPRSELSRKTNPDKLDHARERLIRQVAALPRHTYRGDSPSKPRR